MNRFLTLLILSVLITNNISGQSKEDSIVKLLKEKMEEQKIPGLQFIIIKNKKIIVSENIGMADVAFSVPVNDNTIFSINSISKVFAGTAIMQLVERGKIKLSETISTYIDDLPLEWQKVTLRQVMGHTSGLPDIEDTKNGGLIGGKGYDYAWTKVKEMPLQSKAGIRFSYNATNYLLVQKIIEKYGEMPFEDFIYKNQFKVAGIKNIYFGNSFDVMKNKSSTYSYYLKDKITNKYIKGDMLFEISEEFASELRADAGAFATSIEISKWIISLQKGEFISKKSIDIMWNPVKLNDGSHGGFGGFLNAYALGWPVINRGILGGVAPIGGGRASFVIYPKENTTIILFTNLTGSSPHKIVENISKVYFENLK